jgi:uncharacterized protein YihD (DUF1040 family)
MSYLGLNKKVFDKMPKQEVELSKMEVELALVDDMKASIKAAKDARIKVASTASAVRAAIEGLKKDYKELYNKALEAGTNIENYQKAAKELGLDVPNDIKSELGLMKDHRKLGDTMQGKLTKIEL